MRIRLAEAPTTNWRLVDTHRLPAREHFLPPHARNLIAARFWRRLRAIPLLYGITLVA